MFDAGREEVLGLIKDAVADEAKDAAFYEYLIANAPAMEEKRIIAGIRDDEKKHYKLFGQLYEELTGQTLPRARGASRIQPVPYCKCIKKALLGKQEAVQKYRGILFALEDRDQIDMLTEIITDELRHLGLFNYLYAKNRCRD